MTKSIYLFLDESGEEGFAASSSEWFILSGAIQDAEDFKVVQQAYSTFKSACDRQDNWHFHFINAEHRMRLAFIKTMRDAGHVLVSVAVHKPSLRQTDNFKKPYYLYFYAAKLLLERVSWICRRQNRTIEGIIFSSRRGLKQENVESYLKLLKANASGLTNSIYWPATADMEIRVMPNKALIGLQVADLKASSVWQAISHHPYQITEPRYLIELRDQCYSYGGTKFSYGLKFFPALTPEMRAEPRFQWLGEFDRLPKPTPLAKPG